MSESQRIPALIDTLRRVARFATLLQPKGISVRFLSHDKGTERYYDDLTEAHDIAVKVTKVPFYGNTRLGEVPDRKIVQPIIIQKIESGEVERPVFVVLITDGQVSCLYCTKTARFPLLLITNVFDSGQ